MILRTNGNFRFQSINMCRLRESVYVDFTLHLIAKDDAREGV